MPRFPRLVVPGFPHHVTQRGVRRQRTFFSENDYSRYLRLAREQLERSELEIWAYCLMPNHIHAIVRPVTVDCLATFFAPLHRKYARQTNEEHSWRGHLWQERFYSVAMDEAHTLAGMRYVELNPVRAGMCNRPQEWPWSSVRGNLGLCSDPLVDRSNTASVISEWGEYLEEPENPEQLEQLREQTSSGRPDGSSEFVSNVESLSGRRVRRRRPGPSNN